MARNRYLDDEAEDIQKINTGLLKRLFKYTIPYKKKFILGLTLLICNVLVTLIWPMLLRWMIDSVLTPGGAYQGNFQAALLVTGCVAAVLFLDVFFAAKRVVVIIQLGHYTICDIRQELFDHVQSLSFRYFDDRPAGKILVRITGYVDQLANLLSSQLIQLIVDVFTLVVIVIIMLCMSPKLTLISFVVLLPIGVFMFFFRKFLAFFARRLRAKASNRTAYIHENIMGSYVTQAFNREQMNDEELIRLDDDVNRQFIKQTLTGMTLGPTVDLFSTFGTILVYFAAYQMIGKGAFTLGLLMAFSSYMSRFWGPITSFSGIFSQFSEATSNIERIFESLDTEPDIQDAPDAYDLPSIQGLVNFHDVTFSYDGSVNVLEHVSFQVQPGQMIALVGPTGAGKTTVVSLLSRFYDVTGGSVTIDGHDVRQVTGESLRMQVGVMMQDSFIFSGTILDNIRYSRPDATEEDCIAAAQKVYASEFIEALPEGYHTKVQERGAGLSTGERQLLSFARTVLADPRILILDEATSSIDTKTELMIQRALAQLLEGRTSFVIAHRLSTIKRADRIMCIANKGIAESGTHDELMARKGIYYELNMSQYHALIQHG